MYVYAFIMAQMTICNVKAVVCCEPPENDLFPLHSDRWSVLASFSSVCWFDNLQLHCFSSHSMHLPDVSSNSRQLFSVKRSQTTC